MPSDFEFIRKSVVATRGKERGHSGIEFVRGHDYGLTRLQQSIGAFLDPAESVPSDHLDAFRPDPFAGHQSLHIRKRITNRKRQAKVNDQIDESSIWSIKHSV